MATSVDPLPVLPVTAAEARTHLRIEPGDAGETAAIEAMIRAACDCAEQFIGRLLIARQVRETVPSPGGWRRLSLGPVRTIAGIETLAANGAATALPVGAYAIDIDADGDGLVRIGAPTVPGRARVTYRAGIADDAAGVPEAIRHGLLRLVAHLHAERGDGGRTGDPPAAVAALWRPWRRLPFGGGR